MSGSRSRRLDPPAVSSRAITILVEAQGELLHAETHLATLPPQATDGQRAGLILAIKMAMNSAFKTKSPQDLENILSQVVDSLQELILLVSQAEVPPTAEWRHLRQLAADWLSCSQGRVKVSLTYARLDLILRGFTPRSVEEC